MCFSLFSSIDAKFDASQQKKDFILKKQKILSVANDCHKED
jgi:hypothetical protein